MECAEVATPLAFKLVVRAQRTYFAGQGIIFTLDPSRARAIATATFASGSGVRVVCLDHFRDPLSKQQGLPCYGGVV